VISIEQNFGPHIEQKWASFTSRLIPALPGEIILPSMETRMLGSDISAKLRRLAWLLRARDVEIKLKHLAEAVAEAKFNPNEPRVPAGNPDGGQWTTGAGGGSGVEATISLGLRRISSDLEEECWTQYQRDLFHCRMVGVPACYEQAMLRYSNCLVGRQIPPLNY
jgi:hypothetical protein